MWLPMKPAAPVTITRLANSASLNLKNYLRPDDHQALAQLPRAWPLVIPRAPDLGEPGPAEKGLDLRHTGDERRRTGPSPLP